MGYPTSELPIEDVRSYPRPPALERVPQTISVVLGGVEIISTTGALRVLETHHAPTYYIPLEAIDAEIVPAAGRSFCEWKGSASYWSLAAGGVVRRRCAWGYPAPAPGFADLAGYLAIYA